MKNRVEEMLGIEVPIVLLVQGPTVTELADELEKLLKEGNGAAATAEPAAEGVPA